jgi:hypothetical protein
MIFRELTCFNKDNSQRELMAESYYPATGNEIHHSWMWGRGLDSTAGTVPPSPDLSAVCERN